ncbi:MAG: hypothetical protein K0U64_00370 [Actinomycetia bacterium]|nr:hypothetical protein [Actinomycetes bacterium]
MTALRRSTLLAVAAAVLIGINVLIASAVSDVFDTAEVEQAPAQTVPEEVPVEAPAFSIANKIIGQGLPDAMKPKAPAEPGVVDVLALGCGPDTAQTAALGYQRTVKVSGKTVVAAVEVWPTGYGAAAVANYRDRSSQCLSDSVSVWSRDNQVAGYPGVIAGIEAAGSGAKTMRWAVGDLTLSLTGQIPTTNTSAAQAWTKSAQRLLAPDCADLNPTVSDAKRSPWHDPDAYTGLLDKTQVSVTKPVVTVAVPKKRPNLDDLEIVERPAPPVGVPIWPASLPNAVSAPNRPERPKDPKTKRMVSFQIPDPVGPGCGWDFTTSPAIPFTQEESDADRTAQTAQAKQRLEEAVNQWGLKETQWRQDMVQYYRTAEKYRVYAGEVQTVATAWDKIRSAWAWYQTQQAQREAAIADRKAWVAARAEAEVQWTTNRCPAGVVPTPTPTTVPPTPGAPTPTPTPACLIQPPAILAETKPKIPPEPIPPADPRPASAR